MKHANKSFQSKVPGIKWYACEISKKKPIIIARSNHAIKCPENFSFQVKSIVDKKE
jgi:hypothetical protein